MKLYGLKNCDTCRKALKALADVEFVDVRSQGVPDEVMNRALALFGAQLVNTRSTTWRGLALSERACPPLELLVAHPALMKRPLIVRDDQMWLGWTAQTQKALGTG